MGFNTNMPAGCAFGGVGLIFMLYGFFNNAIMIAVGLGLLIISIIMDREK